MQTSLLTANHGLCLTPVATTAWRWRRKKFLTNCRWNLSFREKKKMKHMYFLEHGIELAQNAELRYRDVRAELHLSRDKAEKACKDTLRPPLPHTWRQYRTRLGLVLYLCWMKRNVKCVFIATLGNSMTSPSRSPASFGCSTGTDYGFYLLHLLHLFSSCKLHRRSRSDSKLISMLAMLA